MIEVEAAERLVLERVRPLEAVAVPLAQALGTVLRQDVTADADQPPFDASAMDGYAARRADLGAALRVVGESSAGAAWEGTLAAGQCVRIFTGAPVPAGADCVVKQEDTAREGAVVRALRAVAASHIRRRGENRRAGAVVVASGTRLGAADLAALAAVGATRPLVSRPARCVHVATGDELVAPDQAPRGAQIRDSNSVLIAALLASHRAELAGQARVGDDPAAVAAAAERWGACDVLLLSGGAGFGERDPARAALQALGYELVFTELNLRPGKPLLFARRGGQVAFVLPGNPVSHWVVFHLFVAPLLRALEDGRGAPRPRLTGRLARPDHLPALDGRATYWPCRVEAGAGGAEVTPLPLASSGDSAGLAGANGLLPLPPGARSVAAGQEVSYLPCP
ncbi:MAG TPA: gephyrin-like molybdotransferase Glp [Opitutaceae bacterium]|nr:gephyrin-like molybdotransferase Glp [Opitutaceae bacterium]